MVHSGKLSVSVVIPVHNGGINFRKCLSSLANAKPPPYEIIVVLDGDDDNSAVAAQEYGAQVIKLPESGGPARARNRGARAAEGDVLFFMDADVSVCLDAFSIVSSAFSCEPDLTAVIGSYDDEPEVFNFLSQFKNLFHHFVHQRAKEEASTFWGACGAVRRETFLLMGGFNEGYITPSIEDIELGYRMKMQGHSIRLIKSLRVKHLKRWGLLSLLNSDIFQRALPWTRLILHSRVFINDLNLAITDRISVGLVYVLLGTLVGAIWWPGILLLSGGLMILLLSLNIGLYSFLQGKGGYWFAFQSVGWHWFYYFYSGLAFAFGTVSYLFEKCFTPRKASHEIPRF
jgi:glycosyltransferase involved in cell wall biosynthesis